jgi:hypothetical protein
MYNDMVGCDCEQFEGIYCLGLRLREQGAVTKSRGPAMVVAVSRRPFAVEARAESQASSFSICGGQKWHCDSLDSGYFIFLL